MVLASLFLHHSVWDSIETGLKYELSVSLSPGTDRTKIATFSAWRRMKLRENVVNHIYRFLLLGNICSVPTWVFLRESLLEGSNRRVLSQGMALEVVGCRLESIVLHLETVSAWFVKISIKRIWRVIDSRRFVHHRDLKLIWVFRHLTPGTDSLLSRFVIIGSCTWTTWILRIHKMLALVCWPVLWSFYRMFHFITVVSWLKILQDWSWVCTLAESFRCLLGHNLIQCIKVFLIMVFRLLLLVCFLCCTCADLTHMFVTVFTRFGKIFSFLDQICGSLLDRVLISQVEFRLTCHLKLNLMWRQFRCHHFKFDWM